MTRFLETHSGEILIVVHEDLVRLSYITTRVNGELTFFTPKEDVRSIWAERYVPEQLSLEDLISTNVDYGL